MTSSTEDRHTISTPRIIKNTNSNGENDSPLLSWEVDIYRQGVDSPVDTVVINNETLPPRYNRKGKIVWRLPDEAEKIPSFGVEDKKRIMDVFKHQKKSRRKARQKSSTNNSDSITNASNAAKNDCERKDVECTKQDTSNDANVTKAKNKAQDEPQHESQSTASLPPPPPPPGFSNQPKEQPIPVQQQQQPILPDKLYFLIPGNTLPNLIPTTIAKSFISTYYPYFTSTSPPLSKLPSFYTPTAQKSISIGEAHSVVISKQEIFLQLQHFQKTITFSNIIGVVAQMSHNNAIHLLITGNAKQHQQQYFRSFAHSIQLVLSREGDFFGYQIQNDALALLNEIRDVGVVVENVNTDTPA